MTYRILVVTPNADFGELIHRILKEAGNFQVWIAPSRSRALTLSRQHPFDLVVLDSDLHSISLRELGNELVRLLPEVRLVVIPPIDNQDRIPVVGILPDGFLSKPFYPPDLAGYFRQILTQPQARHNLAQPVWVIAPKAGFESGEAGDLRGNQWINPTPSDEALEALSRPRSADQGYPPAVSQLASFPWLQDPDRAKRYLTHLTVETSAHAAFFIRQGAMWANAGQLSRTAVLELAAIVIRQPSSISALRDRQVYPGYTRYTRLETTGEEVSLHTIYLGSEIALTLVFDAQIPFSKMRSEATSLANSLSESAGKAIQEQPQQEEPPQEEEPEDREDAKDFNQSTTRRANAFLSPELIPPPEPGWVRPPAVKPTSVLENMPSPEAVTASPFPPARIVTRTPVLEAQTPAPPAPQVIPVPPAQDVPIAPLPPVPAAQPGFTYQPVSLPPDEDETAVGVVRAPSILYNLTYACVLAPRMPSQHLTHALAHQFPVWLRQLALSYAWRLEYIAVRPDHLAWLSSTTPDMAPERLVETVRLHTSRWIHEQFPQLALENPSGEFWAPGYLILTTRHPPPASLVNEFVKACRCR